MMINHNGLYALHIKNALAAFMHQSRQAFLYVLWFALTGLLQGLIAALVIAFEFEILYSVFRTIGDEDSTFWTPEIMGLSTLILVVAVHFIAEKNAEHPSIGFINKVAATLLPVYLLGIGLFAAVILYNSGIPDIAIPEDVWADTGLDAQGHWLSDIMGTIAAPVAAILFCLGIGAMAITNVFVSHHALRGAAHGIREVTSRSKNYHADLRDYKAYQAAEKAIHQCDADLNGLVIRDTQDLKEDVATDILLTIDDKLTDKRAALAQAELMGNAIPSFAEQTLNAAALKKAIKALDGITRETIFKHMK